MKTLRVFNCNPIKVMTYNKSYNLLKLWCLLVERYESSNVWKPKCMTVLLFEKYLLEYLLAQTLSCMTVLLFEKYLWLSIYLFKHSRAWQFYCLKNTYGWVFTCSNTLVHDKYRLINCTHTQIKLNLHFWIFLLFYSFKL